LKAQPAPSPRALAARVLTAVIHDGAMLDRELDAMRGAGLEPRDQAFVQECTYGVLRRYHALRHRLASLIERPLRKRDAVVEALLLSALYQLFDMNAPAHAVVDASANACRVLDKAWAAGLINATLRNALRHRDRYAPPTATDVEAYWNHPQWLVDAIAAAWPEDWRAVLTAAAAHPPFALRVNARRTTRDDYLTRLRDAGIGAAVAPFCAEGVVPDRPLPVTKLPGFDEGLVSVQDVAAQLAAPLLGVTAGERVLDACAAPGGKAMHLLETCAGPLDLTALDVDAQRLARVTQNAERLGLQCRIVCGDAAEPTGWWDGQPYDRILLDAPCSATGVIRRHPDIKLHRRPADLPQLVARQSAILDALWPLLRDGGKLLYATCSVLPAENDAILAAARGRHGNFLVQHISADWGRPTAHGRQILSGEHNMDGFYYALVEKRAHE
jgi:16S rRNA (cytosine967-C5)-methyltransferase